MKKHHLLIIIFITFLITLSIASAEDLNDTQTPDKKVTYKSIEKINTKHVTTTTKKDTEKLKTKISVESIPTTYVGDNVTFIGRLSSEKEIPESTIHITESNTTQQTTTNQNGEYSLTITVPTKGTHTYTISYDGNDEFEASNTTIKFNGVQRRTVLSYNPVQKEYVGTEIHITGRLSHQGEPLNNQKMEIHLNNNTVHTYTDIFGIYNYTFTPIEEQNYTVDIYYHGTNIYQANQTHATFNIIKRNTNLTMSLRAINYYGNISNITGKLIAAGEVVPNTKLSLNINNKTITVYTNNEGIYQYNYTVPNDQNHTVTAYYTGNTSHNPCNTTKTFQVYKIKTKLFMNPIPETEYDDTATIRGTLITGNNTIPDANITLTINTQQFTITTNSTGNYKYNYKVENMEENRVLAEYHGNYTYYPTNTTATFTPVKKNTKINLNYIPNKKYNEEIQIKGKLENNRQTIPDTEITVKYNNQTIKTRTDTNGEYRLTQKTTIIGQNNITITYNGNTRNKATTTSRTFTVTKQKTKITIKPIPRVHYTENTNITGKLTDINTQPIKNTKITIKINNREYTTQTNNQGTYKLNYKTAKAGQNNMTITYNGNKNHEKTITKTTFTTANMPTKLTINKIPSTIHDKTITITGTLKDKNNKAITNQTINIQINNKKITAQTDNKGIYKIKYKTTQTGTNKITTTLNQENYQKNTQYRTFQVKKQTTITINKISTQKYNKTIKISGKLLYKQKPVKNQQIQININGKTLTSKTNNKGQYTIKHTIKSYNTHKITIKYGGTTTYTNTTKTTTFKIKQPTQITINKINTPTKNKKIKISGQLLSKNKPLKNQNITITVNNKKYNTKTDNTGHYEISHKITKTGTNKITITYKETANYESTQKTAITTIKT